MIGTDDKYLKHPIHTGIDTMTIAIQEISSTDDKIEGERDIIRLVLDDIAAMLETNFGRPV